MVARNLVETNAMLTASISAVIWVAAVPTVAIVAIVLDFDFDLVNVGRGSRFLFCRGQT